MSLLLEDNDSPSMNDANLDQESHALVTCKTCCSFCSTGVGLHLHRTLYSVKYHTCSSHSGVRSESACILVEVSPSLEDGDHVLFSCTILYRVPRHRTTRYGDWYVYRQYPDRTGGSQVFQAHNLKDTLITHPLFNLSNPSSFHLSLSRSRFTQPDYANIVMYSEF